MKTLPLKFSVTTVLVVIANKINLNYIDMLFTDLPEQIVLKRQFTKIVY